MVGAVLGVSPYMTRDDAARVLLGQRDFKGNYVTELGKYSESVAALQLMDFTEFEYNNANEFYVGPGDYSWLGATPDGLGDGFCVEIKCPFSKKPFLSSADLPHYYAQMQIQMLCTRTDRCIFYQWRSMDDHKLEIIRYNKKWFDDNMRTVRIFYQTVVNGEYDFET